MAGGERAAHPSPERAPRRGEGEVRPPTRARIWLRRTVAVGLAMATVAALSGLASFPVRTLLRQREDRARSEQELRQLEADVAQAERRVAELSDPAAIERIARDQYDLVRPGEDAFRVRPAPTPAVPVPEGWPFHLVYQRQQLPR